MLVGGREAPAVVQLIRATEREGQNTEGWKNGEHRVDDGWLEDP